MTESLERPDVGDTLTAMRLRLEEGLAQADPHHRLRGRPVSYRALAGPTLEVVYRDVPRIEESEVQGVKRLLGPQCYCIVEPQTAETLMVRFVVPIEGD
jgi:hypothetical protein